MYGTCTLLIQWDSLCWKKDKNRKHLLIQYQQDNQLSIRLKIQKETEQTKQILKSNYAALVFRSWVSHFSRWWQWICDFALRLRSNFWSVTIWFRFTFKPYTATYMLIVHVHLSHAFMYKIVYWQEIPLFQNFIVQKYSNEET